MENQIIVKGRLEPKSNILSKPEFYSDATMLSFILPEAYKQAMLDYYHEYGFKEHMEITLRPWPQDPTDRARKFFFKLRDLLAEHMGDGSREHKDHLYRSCVRELDIRKGDMVINSLKDLDKRGLWAATELMHQWAIDAGTDLRGLVPEYDSSQRGLKE